MDPVNKVIAAILESDNQGLEGGQADIDGGRRRRHHRRGRKSPSPAKQGGALKSFQKSVGGGADAAGAFGFLPGLTGGSCKAYNFAGGAVAEPVVQLAGGSTDAADNIDGGASKPFRRGNYKNVWAGEARMTHGGLQKSDLKMNKRGKVVSKRRSALASKRLRRFQYTKSGQRRSGRLARK